MDSSQHLRVLQSAAASCTRCVLGSKRTQIVWSRGRELQPDVAFVGEGPGQLEDETGIPFVGPAGQLLDRMIAAMGLQRDEIYVCNVVKCRPPGNRTPFQIESYTCRTHYLEPQLRLVQPRVIIALGRTAVEALGLPVIGAWRGCWSTWQSIPTMATYHPAYLLRDPSRKTVVWEDLKSVLVHLGRPVP